MIKVLPGFVIAFIMWFFMFSPWTKDYGNFWILMLISTTILISYSIFFGREHLKNIFRTDTKLIVAGIFSSIILYLLFYVGYLVSNVIFDFTNHQVANIYSTKNQGDKFAIGFALFFWIGPAEEIFWRGFAQHQLSIKYGNLKGYLLTTLIYAFVHIWAFNFILFMAALICGLFWGWMFMKYKSLTPVILSHALWDLLIFIIIPII